jgi:polyisoprenoid-binding protein YceI
MLRQTLAGTSLALAAAMPAWAAAENFDLDAQHTYPSFEIMHLGFSEMRGSFFSTSGSMVYDQEKRIGSVAVTIDAASIATGFAKRDEHLRSKDFFNVEKYPMLSYRSDTFELDPDKAVPVTGTLTMLGVSKPVTLDVRPTRCGQRMDHNYVCGALVSGTIKRSDWGLNAFVPYVGDDVKLHIEVEAIRK